MTDGVHVIHQLTQVGRSLIAVLLTRNHEDLRPLEALRACVALLRRFSGRYVCGLRSGELIEEFCHCTSFLLLSPPPFLLLSLNWAADGYLILYLFIFSSSFYIFR
jgi:hypothetical protein